MFQALSNLPFQAGIETRLISAENPTGAKGGGCKWDPDPANPELNHSAPALDLGRGWKVRPFITVKAGTTVTLADVNGPGTFHEIFLTSDIPEYRALILRIYWDNEKDPSVEVPLGDFFAMGHDGAAHTVSSLPVTVAPHRGCNCYWPMPFRKHARITIENQSPDDARVVAYKMLYKVHDVPADAAYFHAQWRRSLTQREHPEHVILENVRGKGAYVGTYLAWCALSRGWWGEGEVKFYIDGDKEFPSMADSGTEDYFGGAWCFYEKGIEREYNSPFLGLPLAQTADVQGPRRFSLYRWHILDSIGFNQDLKVTVQALGWFPKHRFEPLTDDIASVAYWYQTEPHTTFPKMLPLRERWSR